MSYPLDNPRKEDLPVPVGRYFFEPYNHLILIPVGREEKAEEGALSLLTFDLDRSLVIPDDPIADGKAQTGSLPDPFGREEGFKYFFLDFFGDAAAVVFEINPDPALFKGGTDPN